MRTLFTTAIALAPLVELGAPCARSSRPGDCVQGLAPGSRLSLALAIRCEQRRRAVNNKRENPVFRCLRNVEA